MSRAYCPFLMYRQVLCLQLLSHTWRMSRALVVTRYGNFCSPRVWLLLRNLLLCVQFIADGPDLFLSILLPSTVAFTHLSSVHQTEKQKCPVLFSGASEIYLSFLTG
jgi:hypothetical protein